MDKRTRHAAILELIRDHHVPSQEALRQLLIRRGVEVTQATLSRDIRELRLVKAPDPRGGARYRAPSADGDQTPPLARLLGPLFVRAEGTGNLLLVKTLTGGAQPVAVALDSEEWPEVLGTVAGDDTILVVLRDPAHLARVTRRIQEIAGVPVDSTGDDE